MVGNADDTAIYAVIHRLLSRPQVMEPLNQNLTAIHFWCLKQNMKLNVRKTKSVMVNRSWTYAPGNGDLTVGGKELQEVKGLRILGVTFGYVDV